MCGTSRSRKRQLLPQTSPFLLGQQIASLQKCYIFLNRPHQLLALCFLIQHIHSTLETLCLLSIQSLRVYPYFSFYFVSLPPYISNFLFKLLAKYSNF